MVGGYALFSSFVIKIVTIIENITSINELKKFIKPKKSKINIIQIMAAQNIRSTRIFNIIIYNILC